MAQRPYEHILYEVERGRARITLNQPKRRNPLSSALLSELVDALWEADDDRAVHCVILRANGPAFCAGYDLAPPKPQRDDDVNIVPAEGSTKTAGISNISNDSFVPFGTCISQQSLRSQAIVSPAERISRSTAISS